MSLLSSSKHISPHWLKRLFGAESATFWPADENLQVVTENNETYLILVESLANEVRF